MGKQRATSLAMGFLFVADICVVLVIAASRGSKVITSTLGESYNGILCGDDFSVYSVYHKHITGER